MAVVATFLSPPTVYSVIGKVPKSGSGKTFSVTTVSTAGPPPERSKLVRTIAQASGGKARSCKAATI